MYPRYELFDEFRRLRGGHTFHIASFSQFLDLYGASDEVVEEVRHQEESQIEGLGELGPRDQCRAEQAVIRKLRQSYPNHKLKPGVLEPADIVMEPGRIGIYVAIDGGEAVEQRQRRIGRIGSEIQSGRYNELIVFIVAGDAAAVKGLSRKFALGSWRPEAGRLSLVIGYVTFTGEFESIYDLPKFYSNVLRSEIREPRFLRDYLLCWLDLDLLARALIGSLSDIWVSYRRC